MEQGRNKGSRLDLGTALISIGYAFASVTLDGRPVYPPYLIAETQAKNTKSGLWAFPTCPIRTPSFLRITSLQSPRAPPLRRIIRARRRNLDRSTASFCPDLAGSPCPLSIWARSLAYRQNVTPIAVAPPATAIHKTTIINVIEQPELIPSERADERHGGYRHDHHGDRADPAVSFHVSRLSFAHPPLACARREKP